MTRRENCWDNAPQGSFFRHLKDEIELDTCETLQDVIKEISLYIAIITIFIVISRNLKR